MTDPVPKLPNPNPVASNWWCIGPKSRAVGNWPTEAERASSECAGYACPAGSTVGWKPNGILATPIDYYCMTAGSIVPSDTSITEDVPKPPDPKTAVNNSPKSNKHLYIIIGVIVAALLIAGGIIILRRK